MPHSISKKQVFQIQNIIGKSLNTFKLLNFSKKLPFSE